MRGPFLHLTHQTKKLTYISWEVDIFKNENIFDKFSFLNMILLRKQAKTNMVRTKFRFMEEEGKEKLEHSEALASAPLQIVFLQKKSLAYPRVHKVVKNCE